MTDIPDEAIEAATQKAAVMGGGGAVVPKSFYKILERGTTEVLEAALPILREQWEAKIVALIEGERKDVAPKESLDGTGAVERVYNRAIDDAIRVIRQEGDDE